MAKAKQPRNTRDPVELAGVEVKPGTRQTVDVPLPGFYTHSSVSMPVHVIHGKNPGPCLLVSAAIHGDEINGVEIIRRILTHKRIERISGTLIAIPVVNVFGFLSKSRYLPDRRDLNRSFPGSESGSMAARLANILVTQIFPHCSHAIDLHTGAVNRENLPQVRAKLKGAPNTEAMARAFGVPVILNANFIEGSFRDAANAQDIPVILYEAGEALRFDELAIRAGVKGVLGIMNHLGMRGRSSTQKQTRALIANASQWVRAGRSGILRALVASGSKVESGDILAYINDPLGENSVEIISPISGIVIGKTNLPLVFEGEAVFHIASFTKTDHVSDHIEAYHELLDPMGDDANEIDEPPLV